MKPLGGDEELAQILRNDPSVEELIIRGSSDKSSSFYWSPKKDDEDEDTKKVMIAIRTNSTITKIDIRNVKFGSSDAVTLRLRDALNNRARMNVLTEVWLENNYIGAKGAQVLVDAILTE